MGGQSVLFPARLLGAMVTGNRMTKIRILHLSDIHFGQEIDGSFHEQEDVRGALTADCRIMRAELGTANGIVVTGDIAFAGRKAEYDRAGVWLDGLCDVVHCRRNAVHTIPGNHDIDRSKIDFMVDLVHQKLRECQHDGVNGILSKIVGNDAKSVSTGAGALFDKLAAYREFAERYESNFQSEARPVSIKEIRFPSGHILRFLGLTSVQVSDAADDVRKMVLGSNQYVFAPEENVEYVVMCHHPFNWFKDEALAMPRIRTRGRIMLSGHEHQPAFRHIHENDSEYVMLDAGAANPPQSEQRSPHCYNWIEFECVEKNGAFRLEVSVYPRVWITNLAKFGPDQNRIGGYVSQTYSVGCPNFKKITAAKTSAEPATPLVPIGIHEEEAAAMPDEERFAKLLYFFWRYLDWQQRYGVLAKVEVLPQGMDRPMPQVLERNALATARAQDKLSAIWDEVMTHVPEAEREPNPF
jgi:hypothetical protein